MINNLDRNIGDLIDKLKEKNVFENTFIIFTSDNGGYYGKITTQKPLRAGKGSYYEGGIRVPFFFHWKRKIKSGVDNKTCISHLPANKQVTIPYMSTPIGEGPVRR